MPTPVRPRRAAALALLASLVSVSAHADPLPSLNLRGFSPAPGPNSTLYLEPVNTPGSYQFNTSGWVSWAYRPLVVRQNGEIAASLVKQQTSFDAAFAIGLGKRVEVGLVLPLILEQGSDDNALTQRVLGDTKIPSQAIGDPTLAAKLSLVPVGELGGFGLALVGRLGLPVGSRASTIGEGTLTSEARLLAEFKLVAATVQATAGFKLRADERSLGNKTWGDEIPWGFGVQLKPQMFGLDDKGRWLWGIETHGSLPAGPDAPFTSQIQSQAFAGATARYSLSGAARDVSLLGGAEAGLTKAAGSSPVRLVAGVTWAPREHDRDHDGIDDDKDECPDLAEDRDGFQDEDGCPDPDNDDDNIPDAEDKCPLEPEDEDGFQDEDGCPDPDNDGDGILDKDDRCPNEAGPRSADPKQNGCPVRDKDGDGILDDKDKCPDQPEDFDGFQDEDGCPDPDNDKDGILDKDDKCPNVAGIASEMPALNGCPSPDKDNDGIPNEIDQCPELPENYNGFEDDDGCPDEKPGKKLLVEMIERRGQQKLEQRGKLSFAKKDGVELDQSGTAEARALVQLLLAHPTWSIQVAVKPSTKPGGEDLARSRAAALVELIVRGARRPSAATTTAWVKGKMPAEAEASGVAILLKTAP
jgi:hypothetical protein